MEVASKKKKKDVKIVCSCGKILENFNSTRGSREHGLCSYCFCGSDIATHPDVHTEKDITHEFS